ncbi:30S ribosome-binding factor RbfA [Anaplasma marginale]|uniref:Ribosome-binding factor A n=1 Tax=Anaplasma marginale TaxID=770 RepID=A0A643CJU0_ANAMA|nr:30S ribosome-binding factor RbfA [Anaplasma marginale]KAA8472832.1 30S ribosome-binding factor RbfA [Anaplasma marginale]KAB0450721.1 30S ribosome-binding factor RbfA [Anaplasma marginale]
MIAFTPSAGLRSLKVASVLKRALAQLFIREFYDLSSMLSISGVKVSEDTRNATVFVAIGDRSVDGDEVVAALNDASNSIRRAVFRYLKLRYVPRLHFKLDVEFDNFLRISEIMATTK